MSDKPNGELKIESGIPIPAKAPRSPITRALLLLKKGNSVLIPGKRSHQISGYLSNAGLTGKSTVHNVEGGVRVWRIK